MSNRSAFTFGMLVPFRTPGQKSGRVSLYGHEVGKLGLLGQCVYCFQDATELRRASEEPAP